MKLKTLAACAPFLAVAMAGCDQTPDNHERASIQRPIDKLIMQPVGSYALVALPSKKNYYELIVKTKQTDPEKDIRQGVVGNIVCSEFRTLRAKFTEPEKMSVIYKTHSLNSVYPSEVLYPLADMSAKTLLDAPAKFNDGKKTGYTQIPLQKKCVFTPDA